MRDPSDDLSHASFTLDLTNLTQNVGPKVFMLYQSSPNPFRAGNETSAALLRFDLPGSEAAHVELAIYDVTGRFVRRLVSSEYAPGAYETRWDGRNEHGELIPSGIYVYRLQAGSHTASRKMNVVR